MNERSERIDERTTERASKWAVKDAIVTSSNGRATFGEEKLVTAAEGDDVEGASDGEGFEEEQERFLGGVDAIAAHRPGPIHDEHKLGFL